jgi:penicillin-binding protein 2
MEEFPLMRKKILPVLALMLLTVPVWGAATRKKAPAKPVAKAKSTGSASAKAPAKKAPTKRAAVAPAGKPTARKRNVSVGRRYYRQTWMEPTYADSTVGDRIDGEDLVARRAAVEALGPYNGGVIVTDAQTGRVLTIVNQKLALSSGFTPCSTIKLVTSMAGLIEGAVTPRTVFRVNRYERMDLTEALARSNNPYFSLIGKQLGFERIAYYSRMFGIGEKAGLNIEGEQEGEFPEVEPVAAGGVSLMTSHGIAIKLTPLQLSALLAMIANNGTMHWLQYPRSREEVETFIPQVKRQMDLAQVIDQIRPGMEGAVEWGSGQRARRTAESSEPIFGKTGTCTHSDQRTHLGWFGSYNVVGDRKLVVVVLLTGGRPVNGPVASGIAGNVYRILNGQNYYTQSNPPSLPLPDSLLAIQPSCCTR